MRVDVRKRPYTLAELTLRFKMVELRIGFVDESASHGERLSANPVVGFYTGPSEDKVAVFDLEHKASGRYLTLQNIVYAFLEIDEIEVFV